MQISTESAFFAIVPSSCGEPAEPFVSASQFLMCGNVERRTIREPEGYADLAAVSLAVFLRMLLAQDEILQFVGVNRSKPQCSFRFIFTSSLFDMHL